ncbi:MAG: molybdate ABC transporter substrate-binding protein [Methanosarcinales archaeon]|nr:molybdate ABC transporter substrate-binding protein [Methanosarcinales archaeon]
MPALALVLAVTILGTLPATAGDDGKGKELTVYAAASLTGAFGEIGELYQIETGEEVIQNFDGSQMLRTQLENGAYADVYASANEKHMQALMSQGLMDNSTVRVLLHNMMAVIVPGDNPGEIGELGDLARPGLKIVVGNREVPVGAYARQVLDNLAADPSYGEEFRAKVEENGVSEETTVNLVVSKVALGEADAGFAYVSDVLPPMRSQIEVMEIPEEYNVVADYYIGVLKGSEHPERAAGFIDYVMSEEGGAVLARYGFTPAGTYPRANAPQAAALA